MSSIFYFINQLNCFLLNLLNYCQKGNHSDKKTSPFKGDFFLSSLTVVKSKRSPKVSYQANTKTYFFSTNYNFK